MELYLLLLSELCTDTWFENFQKKKNNIALSEGTDTKKFNNGNFKMIRNSISRSVPWLHPHLTTCKAILREYENGQKRYHFHGNDSRLVRIFRT